MVTRLVSKREFRGRGLGKRLVESALEFAEENDFTRVHLGTSSLQTEAIALYRKYGWCVVNEEPLTVAGFAFPNVQYVSFVKPITSQKLLNY